MIAQPVQPCPTWLFRLAHLIYQWLVQPVQPIAARVCARVYPTVTLCFSVFRMQSRKVRQVRQVRQCFDSVIAITAQPTLSRLGEVSRPSRASSDLSLITRLVTQPAIGLGSSRVLLGFTQCRLKARGECPVMGGWLWLRDQLHGASRALIALAGALKTAAPRSEIYGVHPVDLGKNTRIRIALRQAQGFQVVAHG